jgi:hypothetical protein
MATYRSPILVALAIFAATAFGQASLKCQVQPKTLAAMRNCYRPLLVFSPSATDARLKRQSEILDADADDMMDRFVLFTPILPSSKGFSAPLDTALSSRCLRRPLLSSCSAKTAARPCAPPARSVPRA